MVVISHIHTRYMSKKVILRLEDGTEFTGRSFGADSPVTGEVVFNTAMTGYPESLTDPSYAGQIMVMTFPLVGNYGVPALSTEKNGLATYMESDRIYAKAIVCQDYSEEYSHWNASTSLAEWLKKEGVPGVTGIDTRELTKVLRENGSMMGKIIFGSDDSTDFGKYDGENYVAQVSCKEVIRYCASDYREPANRLPEDIPPFVSADADKRPTVVLVDCGVKNNIIRCLLKRNVDVVRVPWDYDFTDMEFDGLFLANGPGDPNTCSVTVDHIRAFMDKEAACGGRVRPIMGICMGNQLLAKAAGATIYKLKYGHRSHNQPVRMEGTERCYITTQNHGYAVDTTTLDKDWEPLFTNMNDGSNEGVRHKRYPWFSAQFHPEACAGPTDTEFLFDKFVEKLKGE